MPGSLHTKRLLAGSTLLIPPQEEDEESGRYWIACLLTSVNYGRYVDKPDKILENTRKALFQLREKIQTLELTTPGLNLKDNLYCVRLNSKAFKTPWLLTKRILEHCQLDVRVMNNLDAMDEEERQRTMTEMEQWGCDIEKVREYRAKHESLQDGAGPGEPAASKIEKRKEKRVSEQESISQTKKRKGKRLEEDAKRDVHDKAKLKEHGQADPKREDEDKSQKRIKKRKVKAEAMHDVQETRLSKGDDQPRSGEQHKKEKKKSKSKLKEKVDAD